MTPPFENPWVVAIWLPSGNAYRVIAAFPDRAPAVALAGEGPGRVVLFRPIWRRRRHGDY